MVKEPEIDELVHELTGQGFALVDERARRIRARTGDGSACHLHALLGEFLCISEVLDFLGVFGATIEDSKVWVAFDADSRFGDVVRVDGGEGAVSGDRCDFVLPETLCNGLRRLELAIARLPVGGGVVLRADHSIGACMLSGSTHFDVTDDQQAFHSSVCLWELAQCGGIPDRKADLVVEREVGLRTPGEDGCVV